MKIFAAAVVCLCLISCSDDEMQDVPHFRPMQESSLFPDGASARTPSQGTIARGQLDTDVALHFGREPGGVDSITKSPLPFTAERLTRGQQMFTIHCAVCHGADGYGRGIVVRRGFPPPPSYHDDRLRDAPDGHFFDVITNGYGKMYAYRTRVAVADRWAIVGYIRALQLSQNARIEDVPTANRQALEQGRGKSE